MWNTPVTDPPAPADPLPTVGCSWPIVGCCERGADQNQKMWAEQVAIEVLWAASGRQFGQCAATYRPCAEVCTVGKVVDAWDLVGQGGSLSWDPWGGSVFAQLRCCEEAGYPAIDLWHQNVRTVTEVMIDGVVLDPTAYRLTRAGAQWRLLRVDGGRWPTTQDQGVDGDQVGGWQVKYVHGNPVPYGGRVAAGLYSCELTKALVHDDSCRLPRRIQTVTRAGASMAFVDPMQFIDKGRTGLDVVDVWLVSVNPNLIQRSAQVYRATDRRQPTRPSRVG